MVKHILPIIVASHGNAVDGGNHAPAGMVEALEIMG